MPLDKIWDTIQYRADFFDGGNAYLPWQTFDRVHVDTEFQHNKKELGGAIKNNWQHKKFHIWNWPFPRESNSLNRIRNPWVKLTFEWQATATVRHFLLHDLILSYTI
jgi:hypothetical protein